VKIEREMARQPEEKRLTANQYGTRKRVFSAKQAVNIAAAQKKVLEKRKTKYLEAYYDVSKAYDSVNHARLIEKLEECGVSKQIRGVIGQILNNTQVEMKVGKKEVGRIPIRRGVIQGDSLSPLLFVLSINTVSKRINQKVEMSRPSRTEREVERTLNHLFFMDDLKVVAFSTQEMEECHNIVKEEFASLNLEINDAKCGIFSKGLQIPENMSTITVVTREMPYKYLGIEMEGEPDKG